MRRLITELFKAKSVISFAVVLEWINDVIRIDKLFVCYAFARSIWSNAILN